MELEHHFEKIGTKIRCKKRTKHKGDNEKKPGFNEIELVTSQSDQKVFLILKSPGKEEKIELENMGFISLALSSPSIGFILNSEITNVEMESKKETEKLIRWFIGNIPEKQVCFECEKEEWSGKTEKIKVWIKFKNGELEVASPDPKTIIKGDIISFNFEKQKMSYGKGLTYITFRGESLPGGLLKYMAERKKEKNENQRIVPPCKPFGNPMSGFVCSKTQGTERVARECPAGSESSAGGYNH